VKTFLKFTIGSVVLVFLLAMSFGLFVGIGLRNHWTSHKWFQAIAQKSYQKGPLQFSYYRDWRLVEHEAVAPVTTFTVRDGEIVPFTRGSAHTIRLEGPEGAIISFAMFDPSNPESLDAYADRVRTGLTRAVGDDLADAGSLEPAACPIHGTNYIGFRYHFNVRASAGPLYSYYQYFYLLRSPMHKVMFSMQLPERYVNSPEVNFILDSIRLENEINPVSPMDYQQVNFENLAESLKAGKAVDQRLSASGASYEDVAVARAWDKTLEDLIAAKQPFDEARSNFEAADILNIHTVNLSRDPGILENQFVERRGIANAYWNAARDWGGKLGAIQTAYSQNLRALNVADDRCNTELDRLAGDTGDRLTALRAAYGTDQELGLECNYAVSALETFCSNHDTNSLEQQLKAVVALERKAAKLHGEAASASPSTASLLLASLDPATAARDGITTRSAGASATRAPVGNKVGMIIYRPNDAVAVIGNRTVGIGDTVDGFRIVAIASDSVTVQSAAGVKTALHLGDVLK